MGPQAAAEGDLSANSELTLCTPGQLFVAGLLLLMVAALLVPWMLSGANLGPDVVEQMFSPHLLPALGLAPVMRQGSIDLSVWVGFSLGAATAARLMQANCQPLLVPAGVVAVGLVVGAIHAAGVVGARLPGWGVTLITAVLGVSLVSAMTGGQVLTIPTAYLARWPAAAYPAFMAATFYAAIVIPLVPISVPRPLLRRLGPGQKLVAAMIASAILSCIGGMCWAVKSGQTPLPGHLVGDLRVLAAALLAGAAKLHVGGRSLFTCIMVPVAMLAATVWWLNVWPMPARPVAWNLLALAAMALAAHWAFTQALRTARKLALIWPVLAGLGIISLAVSSAAGIAARNTLRNTAGLWLWLIGAGGALAQWLKHRKAQQARG